MKRQFLREHHNLQDKVKKQDYQDRFLDEGGNFDHGGTPRKRLLSFKGSSVYVDLRSFLFDDKRCLLETFKCHLKFAVDGKVGTVSQLLKNSKVADEVRERYEMTRRSVVRASKIIDVARHPKNHRQFYVVEFSCFLPPAGPIPNPIFQQHFAFRMNVPQNRT